MLAKTTITVDPAWPWSLPDVGVWGLAGTALALALLTVWTYLGASKATPGRVLAVLLLRLAALAVAFIVVLRPSLAHEDDGGMLTSKLLVFLDVSESMNITDEFNNLSRFDNAKRLLTTPNLAELFKRLPTDRKIEVVHFMGADDVKRLDLQVKPTGKRTDVGGWLNDLWQQHGKEPNLRGLILLTDGADNGTRFAALEKAAQFRGACPIFPFALGQTTTTISQKDVAVEKVWTDKASVPAKTKLTVKAAIAAPGFEEAVVRATLWMEDIDGKTMKQIGEPKNVDLRTTPDKVIVFQTDAPDREGEIKLSVKVEPLPGEVNLGNNEASSYVNITKDGVSILWVEAKPRLEPTFAMRALGKDQRFRIYRAVRSQEGKGSNDAADFFQLDKQHYDVIVIGDISAKRFAGADPGVLDKVRDMVQQKGTGLVFLAGYDTFGAGGWQQSPLASILPAQFDKPEQIETKVKVRPTVDGEKFLLKLSLDPKKNQELWADKLDLLEGMTPLGTVDPSATVYAFGDSGNVKTPILVSVDRGKGRVLAFGGDTTYQAWLRSPESAAAFDLFWTQMMLWLARQENSKGNLLVRPDTRRLDLGRNEHLGFTVQFTKGAGKVGLPKFNAKVVGPNQIESALAIAEENREFRGYVVQPSVPGEYRIVVEGEGLDEKKDKVQGKDFARFMVYDEDRENLRPAADHDLLQKLAAASGGQFSLADERKLVQFLEGLEPRRDEGKVASSRWPDWRRNPASESIRDQTVALWQSSALACFVLFTAFLSFEWFLRRRWGMV